MELFSKLFGSWLVFVYHCFDRIVLSGYLMGLQRPGQVVYWLQSVLGIEAITKEVLSSRTQDYVRWVEAFARNQRLPLEWAEKNVRKTALGANGNGCTSSPPYKDPNYRGDRGCSRAVVEKQHHQIRRVRGRHRG
jgi:hypothetical protein